MTSSSRPVGGGTLRPCRESNVPLPLVELTDWLHEDSDRVGKSVLIVGQGKAAVSLARLCATRGRIVTVAGPPEAPAAVFAPEVGGPGRWELVAELQRMGVRLLGGARSTRSVPRLPR